MDTFFVVVLFFLALVMLVWGENLLVDSAANFSKLTGISQFVIGASVVSIVSMLPRLLTCIFFTLYDYSDMAIGSLVGGLLFDSLFVIGLLFVVKPFKFNIKSLKSELYFYFASLIFLVVSILSGVLNWFESCVLFLIFVLFYIQNISRAKCKKELNLSLNSKMLNKNVLIFDILLLLIIGTLLLFFGAKILVVNSIKLASVFGQSVVSYLFVGIGACISEIVAVVIAVRKNYTQIAVGNIIGSGILNVAFLMPILCLVNTGRLHVIKDIIYVCVPLLLLGSLIFIVPCLRRNKSNRAQGVLMLSLYAIFIVSVLFYF